VSTYDDNVENDNLATIIFQHENIYVCWPAYEQENGNNNVNRMSNVQLKTHSIQVARQYDKLFWNNINVPPLHSLVDCAGN